MKKIILLLAAVLTISIAEAQQFNVTGTTIALASPGCYQLTHNVSNAGAVWNTNAIDLTQPFDITLTLNFGRNPGSGTGSINCGGDGMSFIFQQSSNTNAGLGGGVGFHGITPSLGVLMDTWWGNPTDPDYQHISINKNGDETHSIYSPSGICPPDGTLYTYNPNELVSYCAAVGFPSSTDSLDHLFRVTWNPTTKTLNAYYGSSVSLPTTPTITYTGDIVNDIFTGNPTVYWGVGGSSGACWNIQTVCMRTVADFTHTILCAGLPVTFSDSSFSESPIISWEWDFGDGYNSISQNPVHTYANTGTYFTKLTIINSSGFSSTITHKIIVSVAPLSIGAISGSTNVYASETGVDYSVPLIANATTYVWTLPTGAIGSSDSNSIIVNFGNSAVSGYLTVKGYNTCAATTSSSIFVTVNNAIPQCSALFMLVPDTTTLHYYFALNNASGVLPLKYMWSWGDDTFDTIAYPSHIYNTAGYYAICLTITDNTGCTNIYCDSSYLQKSTNSFVYVNVIPQGSLGVNTNEFTNQINVYPNPFKDELNIETISTKEQKLEILNLIGQTVYTSVITKKAVVKTGAFQGGVYFIKLSTDKETVVKKFVKE